MKKMKLTGAIVLAILAMIDHKTMQPLSIDKSGQPWSVIALLKEKLGDKDGAEEIEIELSDFDYQQLRYVIKGIGENMLKLAILL